MTLTPDEVTSLIKKNIPDAEIDITDLKGDNNHYHAKIVSSKFKGLSKINQHKLVYQALGKHMGTTLHALMPQKCVLHVHCVNTISWLVREDFYKEIAELLKGISWRFVEYKKPGIELTRAVKKAIKKTFPEVILLCNHGFVAGANTPEEVYELVKKVSKRLEVQPLKINFIKESEEIKSLEDSNYKLPFCKELHELAFSKNAISIITGGCLFPDQVVFLGNKFEIYDYQTYIDFKNKDFIDKKRVIIIPNKGILIPVHFQKTEEHILFSILLIVQRIPLSTKIRYLTKNQVYELVNWNAEKYRKLINN